MIYDIRQITTCTYASPVTHAHHVLRLTPVNRPGQRVHVSSLQIEPNPVKSREGQTLAWVRPREMRAYPMPPADLPLVPILRDWL